MEYVRLGEWHVLDTDNYDDKTCSYYNEISKQKCLNSKACGNYCKKKNGNFDCSNVVGNPNENCAPEHQVSFLLDYIFTQMYFIRTSKLTELSIILSTVKLFMDWQSMT